MNDKTLPDPNKKTSEWYQEVIARAELAEHAAVKGCMVIRPYGFAIWELIKASLDARLKERDIQNVYFPSLIPESFLAREKKHVEGFAPELAVVTVAGGRTLEEPLVVRPTSETIIHDSMSRWIHSYRDLPMRLNQWVNVIRWEKRPRLFLRNTEFLWQEGHTAHATEAEARMEAERMAVVYESLSREAIAVPVFVGKKSPSERFAGAVDSFSIEGLMPDGKALQMGTSHYLGDSFSKAANIQFLDAEGKQQFTQMTSWGVSTRLLGAVILVHGDEKGLVLPPAVAPHQVVIVPIGALSTDATLQAYVDKVKQILSQLGLRVKVDTREELRPGAKYYHWELRGVPLRIEIGKRDMEANSVMLAWRADGTKQQLGVFELPSIPTLLKEYQQKLLQKAEDKLTPRILSPKNSGEMTEQLKSQAGFVRINWCGESACEETVKQTTTATFRNMPLYDQKVGNECHICSKTAMHVVYAAKAY